MIALTSHSIPAITATMAIKIANWPAIERPKASSYSRAQQICSDLDMTVDIDPGLLIRRCLGTAHMMFTSTEQS